MHIARTGRRWLAGCLLAGAVFGLWGLMPVAAGAESVKVPEDIYKWVQSSARQDYFFNKQQMRYGVTNKKVDKNILIVPTLRVYDDVQIRDIVTKRRWRHQPLDGYNRLSCAAEYLRFDLRKHEVEVLEHDDLDDQWGTISQSFNTEKDDYEQRSERDPERIFYKAILDYAAQHPEDMEQRAQWVISEAEKHGTDVPY